METQLITGINDLDIEILNNLNEYDLYTTCLTSKNISKICYSDKHLKTKINNFTIELERIRKLLRILRFPSINNFENGADPEEIDMLFTNTFPWSTLYNLNEIDVGIIRYIWNDIMRGVKFDEQIVMQYTPSFEQYMVSFEYADVYNCQQLNYYVSEQTMIQLLYKLLQYKVIPHNASLINIKLKYH